MNSAQQFIDSFDRSDLSGQQDWLIARRRNAIDHLREKGLPTTRNENWRYTNVSALSRNQYRMPQQTAVGQGTRDRLQFAGLACHRLVFVNGYYSGELSALHALPEGCIVKDLNTAMDENGSLLQANFSETCDGATEFTTLNTAFIKQGVVIRIPEDAELDVPINIFYLSGGQSSPSAMHPRNIIIAGKNSKAVIIENYLGLDENAAYLNNVVSEITMHDGAKLEHYRIQQESGLSHHIGFLFVRQQRDSHFISNSVALGGALARTDIHAHLHAAGATVDLNGLYIVGGKQHIDNHTRVDHLAPATYSNENYRGILGDAGRGVFNGKVVVHKDAQKIEARQSNANLLLSDDAEVDTKPELQIYADDVQCSHGATVGKLDEGMLFYLRSRAIAEDAAKSILTFAFAQEVMNRCKLDLVRKHLEGLVSEKLSGCGAGEFAQ